MYVILIFVYICDKCVHHNYVWQQCTYRSTECTGPRCDGPVAEADSTVQHRGFPKSDAWPLDQDGHGWL